MPDLSRLLVLGAAGQIGSELTGALRARYGAGNVIASDRHPAAPPALAGSGPYARLDILDRAALDAAVREYRVDGIVNLAAILSANGERHPQACWDVNVNGLINVLETARERGVRRVLCPSSIAAFGPETPRENTPQDTVLRPRTMYGVTKVAGELVADYYARRLEVDVRGLRYPGIISSEALPGGGTTDYAVEIFYKAVEAGRYDCFLRPDTRLPMMYMPDCLRATIELFEAPLDRLTRHSDYNVAAVSFTVGELAAEIARHVPGFAVACAPDFRQEIADSWPTSIDDRAARADWGWAPRYDLPALVADMLARLRARHAAGALYPKS